MPAIVIYYKSASYIKPVLKYWMGEKQSGSLVVAEADDFFNFGYFQDQIIFIGIQELLNVGHISEALQKMDFLPGIPYFIQFAIKPVQFCFVYFLFHKCHF